MTYNVSPLVLLTWLLTKQIGSDLCCKCESSVRSDDVICLNAKRMREHVEHIEPLKLNGLYQGLNLAGTVVLEIRFGPTGRVECARAKSGHPKAIAAAIQAVPKWTFEPAVSDGGPQGAAGP